MAIFVVGDLQGCCDPFARLLDQTGFDPAQDQLWLVGDLINRGPDSLGTLRRVIALGDAATVVLGNHDLHLLGAASGARKLRGDDTLSAILDAPDAAELIDWIRTRKIAHHSGEFIMVHAGVVPDWNASDIMLRAAEVEQALRAPDWQEFMRHMYGNSPHRWKDKLEGWPRLRMLVNIFTRLRFCTTQGELDFESKDSAANAPPGMLPWFDIPGRRSADHTLVFGHWSTLGLVMRENLLATDTGCVWGGKLTAIRLPERALFQVDCPGYRTPG